MMNNPKEIFGGKDLQHKLALLVAVISMIAIVISASLSQILGVTGALGGLSPAITGLVVYATARFVLNKQETKWRK